MTRVLRALLALVGATALLAVSATAAWATDGYGAVKGESAGGGGGGGALPFTGQDLVLYAVVAAGLAASGLALRTYSARRI
jgi:hypothetical protein